jgi:iron complex outermembrane receptor protein
MKTSGIDVGFGYRFPATEYGNFGVQFDGTYVMEYEYQREKGGEFIQAAGKYTDNAPVFRWQHSLVFSWGAGPWGVAVAQLYRSGYTDQTPTNEVRPYQTWDATVTYTGIKNLTLMGGVRNLADKDPPFSNQGTTFQSNYDPRFTDPLGRTWIARVAYKFF